MEKKYRVLLVHNEYQYAGGEDTVVKQDAELLKKHGHSVFFYVRSNDELRTAPVWKKFFLPFTTVFSFRSYREIRELIRRERIEIVHVHNTLPLISYACYFAAKKEKVKLIQTVHNFRLVCPNALFYRNGHICEDCLQKGIWQGVRHGCYRGSKAQTAAVAVTLKVHRILGTFRKPDAYIALTEFNKEKIVSVAPKEKIYVKPNYLELRGEKAAAGRKEGKRETAGPYFLYAARLEKVKGIFVLLEAFQKWEEESRQENGQIKLPQLLLLGTGPDEEQVKEYIEKNHMEYVRCLGFTDHVRTLELIRDAQAVLYPSLWYEGFPMTVVESLACAVPVIASDTPNLSEKLADGESGFLFQTGNANDLYKKLRSFSALSKEEKEKMKRQAETTYEKFFTEKVVYGKMMEIYGKEL